ncbi:hypothetical protein PHYSODRAFT_503367 [Phytophthora sojae]|uniref:Uncharacterized protein n=1 Tax=Phytophthora sojae (strain P6497) TaxID=1094619 RepID=G4ZHH2_PHYSP|nr:hypothetical protein PHYSODRAFT_503367 [Phytophthora sojae]EGZ18052.1 hypothetical protein PHYSODRAFT_503367 [Phytophthora sojae]|eukprot:XP_009527110.1 hypothetical protein PHYSODRAFT_503367 [Phytophthora sojae]
MNADTTISSGALQAVLLKSAAEEAVWDALQTLFHSEYLLLGEYIECALPALYSGYLAILYHLPVAAYYPQTAFTTPHKLQSAVASILLFAAVSFIALLFILRKKFGISPLYQLAFVLETQVRIVQGQLFIWTIFILHLPLAHYGKYNDSLPCCHPW